MIGRVFRIVGVVSTVVSVVASANELRHMVESRRHAWGVLRRLVRRVG
ncbi:MAG TPA: hypothetical protein VFV52_16000 [Bacilli bacterium]|nr:hypothetical protein [Bacilli bacterium]